MRARRGVVLADQSTPAVGDPREERGVLARIGSGEPGREDRDRAAAGGERALVRRCVDSTRPARDHRDARAREIAREIVREVLRLRIGVARADDRDRALEPAELTRDAQPSRRIGEPLELGGPTRIPAPNRAARNVRRNHGRRYRRETAGGVARRHTDATSVTIPRAVAIFSFPEPPDLPAEQRASGDVSTRYEDIAQDGRVKLSALPHAIGEVCWMKLLRHHPVTRITRTEGIVPILSRLVIEGGAGPVSVRRWLEGEGCYQLAHTATAQGDVDRLILELWVDVHGRAGRTHGPAPDNAGERICTGRVYAEHVVTRPFGPAEERKVRSFAGIDDLPDVPPARLEWRDPRALLDLPEGATPLDAELADDPLETVFGLLHTDSNQHVNSLEYPRVLEEAALRRLDAHGRHDGQLSSFVELAYRKPCFAGDRLRVRLRAFELDGTLGAVAELVPSRDPAARPYCYARIAF